jgi:hypothetical protein
VADAADRNVFVILVLTAAGMFRIALLGFPIGSDSWYTLLGGRLVSSSWLPHQNTLTVIAQGRDWVDEQWLGHLVLYGLWSLGSWPLATLILLALYLVSFSLVAAAARSRGASETGTAIVLLPCLVLAASETGFRAQTLACPLFALVVLLLIEDELRPSRRVFLTLPILALWANVHGSVVLGAGLVALRGLTVGFAGARRGEEPLRWLPRGAVLVAVPWLCTIASPYGFALPHYYLRLLDNPTLGRLVTEWQPTTIKNQPLFFVVLLGGLLLVALRPGRALSPFTCLALFATGVAGLLALRHVVWFALVAAAVLPRALDAVWLPAPGPRRRRLNLSIAGACLVLLAGPCAAFAHHSRAWFERDYPAGAGDMIVSAAKADPSLKIFATERYADWLLFEHPSLAGRVAYDVRFEILSRGELQSIAAFRREQGADWMRAADGYSLLVLDPSGDAGVIMAFQETGARAVYLDRGVAVLTRIRG